MIEIPHDLTKNQKKKEIFGGDPFFRDSWDDLSAFCDSQRELVRFLQDVALVVFRPDAIVSREINAGLEIIQQYGAYPFVAQAFDYSRHTVRECWRYQLNVATRDRIDVMDMILTHSSSILVMFRRRHSSRSEDQIPLSVQLSAMKGPSDPLKRLPGQLRHRLGSAQVSVLTYVHISDEPADVVRELGAFMVRQERVDVLKAYMGGAIAGAQLETLIEAQYAMQPRQTLLFEDVIFAVLARIPMVAPADKAAQVSDSCQQLIRGESKDWRKFFSLCAEHNVPLSTWEKVAIAGKLSVGHHANLRHVIPDVGGELWAK